MLALLTQKSNRKTLSRLSILTLAFAALLLTGCLSVQTNVALHGQGQWHGVQAITLSEDFVQLMESEGGSSELTTDTEGLDEWLDQAQDAAAQDNLNVSFNEVRGDDGSLSYILQADGQQLDTLNQVLFQGQAEISVNEVDGQRQITIVYDPTEAEGEDVPTPAEQEMSAEMMQAFGISMFFRITGGQIISHNADRVEGSTAIWETPRQVEVTLTEAAEFAPNSVAPVQAPASSVPSIATLLATAAQQNETGDAESTPAEQTTTESTATETETAPETTTSESTTTTAEPTTETSAEVTEEETAPAGEATTPTTTDNEATAAEAEPALPASGAILAGPVSTTPIILAGLVLVALVGAGLGGSLRKSN